MQTTDYFNVDLRLNKKFVLDDFTIMLYVESRNLLNLKRLSGASFYDVHDQRFYLESLHLPENEGYNNIVGDDRIGSYRAHGVDYQPIEQTGNIEDIVNPDPIVIYYDNTNDKYMNYVDGEWSEVNSSKMDKILEDKAYIDMPNNSAFDFLNPRQLFFGINITFNF